MSAIDALDGGPGKGPGFRVPDAAFLDKHRELGGDIALVAEHFGVTKKQASQKLYDARKRAASGSKSFAASFDREMTMVFTDELGNIMSVTGKAGDRDRVKFTFIFCRGRDCYRSETLTLDPEELAAVRGGLSFSVARSMIRDAARIADEGRVAIGDYVLARVAALRARGGALEALE